MRSLWGGVLCRVPAADRIVSPPKPCVGRQHLSLALCWRRGLRMRFRAWRSSGRGLIQPDCCPYRDRLGHRHTGRPWKVPEEDGHVQAKERVLRRP